MPVLATLVSAPLRTIAAHVLTTSDNNAAELLLRELGTTVALPGTRDNGLAVVRSVLAGFGVDVNALTLVDGSGLDRTNLVTCDALLTVLSAMADNADFTAALAVLGETGTLSPADVGPLATSALAGRMRAKTGSLTGVKSLSGYVPVEGGGMIEFAFVLNSPDAVASYLAAWGTLIDALVTYPTGPTPGQLAP
jgi:D-alanyl-D-alanine carboxypeptidase/D-alanyl-D-alanine-endopeptidase (penicillin-binding protein 4)